MSRKPILKPSDGSRMELMERRLAELESRTRKMPSRSVNGACLNTATMVNQAAHGLTAGQAIRYNGYGWVASKADTAANAVVAGVVTDVLSPSVFIFATSGLASGFSGLTAGSVHYLSATTAGALTITAPAFKTTVLLANSGTTGAIIINAVGYTDFLRLGATAVAFASSGTWTIPGGVTFVRALLIGAGGGGADKGTATDLGYIASSSGGSPTTVLRRTIYGGSGGGGGCLGVEINVTGLTTLTITVGTAGASGATPGVGGTTSITGTGISGVSATGGNPGSTGSASGYGGAGGVGSAASATATTRGLFNVVGETGRHGFILADLGASPTNHTLEGGNAGGYDAALGTSVGRGGSSGTSAGATLSTDGGVVLYY